MAILKYKINGQWVELGGTSSGGSSVEVDPSLSVEGMAADAKATGDAIIALGEIVGGVVTNQQLEEILGPVGEYMANLDSEMDSKQSKAIFSETQPTNWQNGDIWLKPAK